MGILDRIKNTDNQLIVETEKVDISIQDKLYFKILNNILNRLMDKALPMIDQNLIDKYGNVVKEFIEYSDDLLILPKKIDEINKKLEKLDKFISKMENNDEKGD